MNRIQNARKDTGFEVTDKIKLTILKFEHLEQSIEANKDYIISETLTGKLEFTDELPEGIDVEFDGIKSKILIQKCKIMAELKTRYSDDDLQEFKEIIQRKIMQKKTWYY